MAGTQPATLGELKASGYQSRTVKAEMRQNLLAKLRANEPLFPGIIGYEETVIPQVENAVLSHHDMLFLGLRGQGKTRMLRMLVNFLDPLIPVIAGSEVNDDPLAPISKYGRDMLEQHGDACRIAWLPREKRYHEKLATPDVTIADLVGEIDLIKHAEGKHLASEDVMHFGLIPRSHRGIFCMNELPDLSPKIQVGLFNVLEERDVQIRGFPVRLDLDLAMVFSANPEDYTNRGRIVTPLKDRIGSVIRTHYPMTREEGIRITDANAWSERHDDGEPGDGHGIRVLVPPFVKEVLEETARLARSSSAINQASGVSVRMSIANFENVISSAERRGVVAGENPSVPRISDLIAVAPSTRGKIELTLSEDDGQEDRVIGKLVGEAVKNIFSQYVDVKSLRPLVEWFEGGQKFVVGDKVASADYVRRINENAVLKKAIADLAKRPENSPIDKEAHDGLAASLAEFVFEGLHVENKLNKSTKGGETAFKR